MHYSNFINNGIFDFKASACSDPFTIINAEDNFWVATDSVTIADEHVYDNSDDSEAPIVDFVPFLTEEIRGAISGIVTDQMSNPIPDVYVSITGTLLDDYTDANGEYILDGLETNFYGVSFTHNDYNDTTIAGIFIRIGNTTILDVIMQSPCSYVPGDCDADGTARQLTDVIAMINWYRNPIPPDYSCECPGWGEYYPHADADGNCVPFELTDVVWSIQAYRGPVPLTGCEDCPGSGGLLPGGEDQPPMMPSLKSRAKISRGKAAE